MTISELYIQLDINDGNVANVLNAQCRQTSYGHLFVDSENGQCYLFDENANARDIKVVVSIDDNVFYRCTSLTSIKIPNSVKLIGIAAFDNCTSLTSVSIPDSVKNIRSWAFYDCTSLASISIPDSVKNIGGGAFGGCTSLESLVFKGKTIDEVKAMSSYPWGIKNKSVIKAKD